MQDAITEDGVHKGSLIRFLADGYEQSQRIRLATGERLRAILQDRDETFDVAEEWRDLSSEMVSKVLKDIRSGDQSGPVPFLGRVYRRHYEEEKDLKREMHDALKGHPATPWILSVRGIGPTLACKLLARLDPTMANYASSFWLFCGLATVPGEKWRCPTCGKERSWAIGTVVTGKHQTLEGKKCKDLMVMVAGPDDGIRAAMPKGFTVSYENKKGETKERRAYDAYAKKIMFLVSESFLKAGGPYEVFLRKERAKLDRERPGWADGRKQRTARRKTEKLFLAHLWEVWRKALNLPTPDPYSMAHQGHNGRIDPWSMVEKD